MDCMACLRRRHKDSPNGCKPTKVMHDADVTSQHPTNVPFSPNGFQPGKPTVNFTMAELNRITGNFSDSHKIGEGYFGAVYQGRLRDGTTLAIKRAKKDAFEARDREFQTEVDILAQVEHLNLVRLIASLEDQNERLLVTEFVPNGNLRNHLDGTGQGHGVILDMSTRLNIAIDVAQALAYLHYYTDKPIIHRDVKSSNILITDTFRAKVADFGFSRAGPSGEEGATHVSTQVKGTAGYLDPEYLTTYQLNVKSDVYSFGILLVELFTGRRPIELTRPSDERVTVRWAFKQYLEGRLRVIVDPNLQVTQADFSILECIFDLAFDCSAPTKHDRPNMREVKEKLWDIRRKYQLIKDRQQEGSEAGPEYGDYYENGSHTPRESRRPHGNSRTNRRSEEYHRSHLG
ncbi:calmodulin-binding receptor-like cytoplasmic kinase 3 isoform X1 [Physcomitrium patens]|uniref:non-specific serine/threonine protein kinase n=1 Tax=Physcomitrium patens TaxID=3218 RepID=A0A2K1IMX7_PHYPA|nr:calmodulin-binding receptor-like cytoplasmic kinase 3 [Physcomitrium patens]PNR30618.1 hypothetical protein PHYPA_026934 [Physcomitrium patens]|eukprot:XP_024360158.1 calmodulin-binding receptor-like cytoplasmic kinase 3 [Physcomitrella patens]